MKIYPSIDIKDGNCVRLRQGNFNEATVYDKDPIAVAKKWQASGASFIHVVDLDGARQGKSVNKSLITKMCKSVSVPIQFGGGIRNMVDIQEKIKWGVSRIVLGTAAVKSQDFVKQAVSVYGRKIVVSIDAKGGKAAMEGWENIGQQDAFELCDQMVKLGVKTIVYTDIEKDSMMGGPNFRETKRIVDASPGVEVIASGGISSDFDLDRLIHMGVHGVIIGQALFTGALYLDEIISRYER